MTALDISAALSDARMFEPWFSGPSWDGWKAVLRAASGLPMTRSELAFFQSVAGRRDPPDRRVKELVAIVGRRGGKDAIASAIAANIAASFDPVGLLRPGERAMVLCLAVDKNQADIVFSYVKAFFERIPALAALVKRETSDGFELTNDVDVVISTSDYRRVRGRTVLCAIFDEVSYWRDEHSALPDREVYRAIKPGMATLPDSILVMVTTAYKRSGLAYDTWAKYYGKNDPKVLVVHAGSKVFNPTLDQVEIDDDLARDPEAARAEWLSVWRDDLSTYIQRELIEAAVDKGVVVRPPQRGLRYMAFCDTAEGVSQQGDSYTAALAHSAGEDVFVDWMVEFVPPFNPAVATRQIADALRSYGVRDIMGDHHAAGFAAIEYQRNQIRFLEPCELNRSELYLELLPRLGCGRVHLLDNARLITQLCNLERRAMSGGNSHIDHPRGQHDDLSNAVAGAVWRAGSRRPGFKILPEMLRRASQPGPGTSYYSRFRLGRPRLDSWPSGGF